MIAQVKDNGGTKTLEQISGSIPTGNPVGTLITTYKKIQPRNYLYCDGSTFNAGQYPALYLYLGSNVLPDYRECTMVGAEENTTDQITDHDVYAQGEFKDDQIQEHTHEYRYPDTTPGGTGQSSTRAWYGHAGQTEASGTTGRYGATTHGKQKAVYVYIKAVDGVDISDEDTFLVTVKNFVEEKNSYSTTEMLTGGKWIDGKPIYRKVVELSFTQNSQATLNLNIPNIGSYSVIDYGHSYIYGNYGTRQPWNQTNLYINDGIMYLTTSHPSGTLKAVIEYTKTTD